MELGEEEEEFAAAHSHLERSGAERSDWDFLCCRAPACLVTWRRSLGLGSPPAAERERRESEPGGGGVRSKGTCTS